jgi:DNA-binding NarL/FixJ family response regulator
MRVVLVDDHNVIRESIAGALSAAGLEVAGQVSTAAQTLELIDQTPTDVALLDLQLADGAGSSGLDLAEALNARSPRIGILILSIYSYPAYVYRLLALRDRGIGYLLKDGPGGLDALVEAIHRVADGETHIDPALVRQLMRIKRTPEHPITRLTTAELTVLELMAQGRSNMSIAQDLGVAINTVEHHASSIFAKLGLGRAVDSEHRGFNARVMAVLDYLGHAGQGQITNAQRRGILPAARPAS